MTPNQIILLAIVILSSIILVFGAYFLIIFLLNKKREKKIDTIFNPTNLVEEQSLLNVMDEKRNLEYNVKEEKNQEKFVTNIDEVEMISNETNFSQEQKVNPFGVDMTMRRNDNSTIEVQDNNGNKFIN